eukprot:scaffold154269_cov20-Prasinocladus_malaysianus.AAC.2
MSNNMSVEQSLMPPFVRLGAFGRHVTQPNSENCASTLNSAQYYRLDPYKKIIYDTLVEV